MCCLLGVGGYFPEVLDISEDGFHVQRTVVGECGGAGDVSEAVSERESENDIVSEYCDSAHMVHVKFDSGCSRNMSGVRDRLLDSTSAPANVSVRGFNNSVSAVDSVGLNEDGKVEYYVPNMPSDMVLLSAHDGAADVR
jgi:hypothetical protein